MTAVTLSGSSSSSCGFLVTRARGVACLAVGAMVKSWATPCYEVPIKRRRYVGEAGLPLVPGAGGEMGRRRRRRRQP